MMQHIKEEEISAYIDNQLSADESRILKAHLTECEDCRAVYNEMRNITALFQEAERLEPSPYLWNRLEAALNRKRYSSSGWRNPIFSFLRTFSWSGGAAAAALVILLFAGIAIFHNNSGHMADQAALASIDQIHNNLTALELDNFNPFSAISHNRYNPFSAVSPSELDVNPFRNMRLSSRTKSAPEETLQH
jgi:anti-sigma factor RsiW